MALIRAGEEIQYRGAASNVELDEPSNLSTDARMMHDLNGNIAPM